MSKGNGRLGGGSTAVHELVKGELQIHTHSSLNEALKYALEANAEQATTVRGAKRDTLYRLSADYPRLVAGNRVVIEQAVERADAIIAEACIIDPRLNHRHSWVRREEGIDACPALIASGEQACCLARERLRLADQASGKPYRIVISTDDNKLACDENVISFIAAAKLAQQFRPLEIWWQGAWLTTGYSGQVILVPLIQGDMDFTKVQFTLGSKMRDSFSYLVMRYHSLTKHSVKGHKKAYEFGGERGTSSFLDGADHFITEKGLVHSPEGVARWAARWAGLEPRYSEEIDDDTASQYWSMPQPTRTLTPQEERERERQRRDDNARWEREAKERRREEARQAKERVNQL